MKTLFRCLPFLFAFAIFLACSDSDDDGVTRELILSVEPNKFGEVATSEMDFEFEILDGNGGYTAKVSDYEGDPHAKVAINGNKVTVNLLVKYAQITIVDAKNNEQSFHLTTTNKILNNLLGGYGVAMDIDQEALFFHPMFTFGAGSPYTIERVRGTASEITGEDIDMMIKGIGQGITYYNLKDYRGSILPVTVYTDTKQYELLDITKSIEIEMHNNDYASVKIAWGDEWEILKSEETIIENTSIGRPIFKDAETNEQGYADYYSLSIYTTDKGKGTDIITLQNKEGQKATVKVTVK